MRLRTGIFFGGSSRHREQSFAMAVLLLRHLPAYATDKALFFVDREGNVFPTDYPLPGNTFSPQEPIEASPPESLGQHLNLAFSTLAADDVIGERLQEWMETNHIPFSGNASFRPFALDIGKWWKFLEDHAFPVPKVQWLSRMAWDKAETPHFTKELLDNLGSQIQVMPMPHSCRQGGGVIHPETSENRIGDILHRAFFREWIARADWEGMSDLDQSEWLAWITDPGDGPGFPLLAAEGGGKVTRLLDANGLKDYLDNLFSVDDRNDLLVGLEPDTPDAFVYLVAIPSAAIPFQTLLWQDEGDWHCLPPGQNVEILESGKYPFPPLTEAHAAEVDRFMRQLAIRFPVTSARVMSGFIGPDGDLFVVETCSLLESTNLRSWFDRLGAVDWPPARFLASDIRQLLLRQSQLKGLPGRIAGQLLPVLEQALPSVSAAGGHMVLAGFLGDIGPQMLREVLVWCETLLVCSPVEPLIVFCDKKEEGEEIFFEVPLRWVYMELESLNPGEGMAMRIQQHCPHCSPAFLKAENKVAILCSAIFWGNYGAILNFLNCTYIPFWGPPANSPAAHHPGADLLLFLQKKGFQTVPIKPLSEWQLEGKKAGNRFLLSRAKPGPEQESLILLPHETEVFRQFLNQQDDAPTGRNRKAWQQFLEMAGGPKAVVIREKWFREERIMAFFPRREEDGEFHRFFCRPITVAQEELGKASYSFPDGPAESGFQHDEPALHRLLDRGITLAGIQGPGYVKFYFEGGSSGTFQVHLTEISPLNSHMLPWLEAVLSREEVHLTEFVAWVDDFARSEISGKQGYTLNEMEESHADQRKAPFRNIPQESALRASGQEKMPTFGRPLVPKAMIPEKTDSSIKSVIQLLRSPFFVRNVLGLLLVLFLLINGVKGLLLLYTRHGSAHTVADFTGMQLEQARGKAETMGFKLELDAEVYVLGKPAGIVLSQQPAEGARIKAGRTIYCVVTGGEAPMVAIPRLSNNDDYETYRKQLLRLGIFSRISEERFVEDYEEQTILEIFHDGKRLPTYRINTGQAQVPKGSYLDMIISVRNTDRIPIPDLTCNTYEEAVTLITANDFVLGSVYGPARNESFASQYVWRQEPEPGSGAFLAKGSAISLFLQAEKPAGCP